MDDGENVTYLELIYTDKELVRDDNPDAQDKILLLNISPSIDFLYFLTHDGLCQQLEQTRTPGQDNLNDIVCCAGFNIGTIKNRRSKGGQPHQILPVPVPDAWGASNDSITWAKTNDSTSRRLLTTTINLRNMGLL